MTTCRFEFLIRLRRWLSRTILCDLLGDHCGQWTSAAEQGIPPTPEQVKAGYEGFKEYAKMYCRRCGRESKLNRKFFP